MNFNEYYLNEPGNFEDCDEQASSLDLDLDFEKESSFDEQYFSDTILEVYEMFSNYIKDTGAPLCNKLTSDMIYNYTLNILDNQLYYQYNE